jgi:hypothetical protein
LRKRKYLFPDSVLLISIIKIPIGTPHSSESENIGGVWAITFKNSKNS